MNIIIEISKKMKFIRLIFVILSVFLTQNVSAQVSDTSSLEYDFTLLEASINEFLKDTIHTALIYLDTSELKKFKKLTLFSSDNKKEFSIKAEDIVNDSRFILHEGKYILNAGEWGDAAHLEIKGTYFDDSEVNLTNKKEKDEVKHVVIYKEKTKSLKRVKVALIPEEELND